MVFEITRDEIFDWEESIEANTALYTPGAVHWWVNGFEVKETFFKAVWYLQYGSLFPNRP